MNRNNNELLQKLAQINDADILAYIEELQEENVNLRIAAHKAAFEKEINVVNLHIKVKVNNKHAAARDEWLVIKPSKL